jgi:plastocyanin
VKGLVRVGVSAVLSVAAVALAVAACRGGEDRIAQPSAPSPGVAVAGTVHLDMGDNFFSYQGQRNPTIVIKAGLDVRLVLENHGRLVHNFRIDGADGRYDTQDDIVSRPTIMPGEEDAVTFRLEPGNYRFRCDYHEALGMVGAIVAVP